MKGGGGKGGRGERGEGGGRGEGRGMRLVAPIQHCINNKRCGKL